MLVDAQSTLAAYSVPTGQLWVTETNYNLLGPVISEEDAPILVDDTYGYGAQVGVDQIYWYGWDTTASLGGLNINHDTAAWNAIKVH
jgi:hypothetical protein